ELQVENVSTREFGRTLERLSLVGKTMLVIAEADPKVALSARNLKNVRLRVLPGLSTYEVVHADTLLFTQAAVERLQGAAAEAAQKEVTGEAEGEEATEIAAGGPAVEPAAEEATDGAEIEEPAADAAEGATG